MGRAPRPKPSRLSEKLLAIRTALGMSQTQIWRALEVTADYTAISQYESGKREPPLPVLLRYAELANVYVDALIDDRVDLPEKLPARAKHAGQERLAEVRFNTPDRLIFLQILFRKKSFLVAPIAHKPHKAQ